MKATTASKCQTCSVERERDLSLRSFVRVPVPRHARHDRRRTKWLVAPTGGGGGGGSVSGNPRCAERG